MRAASLAAEPFSDPTRSQLVYCNHTFCPSPGEIVGDLHEVSEPVCVCASVTVFCVRLTVHVLCQCFNVNGELVLNYSITDAWG